MSPPLIAFVDDVVRTLGLDLLAATLTLVPLARISFVEAVGDDEGDEVN